MKTVTWQIGKTVGLACVAVAFLTAAGCSFFPHRELTAPCSDYKAAKFSAAPAHSPGMIPCDAPLPMARPPWTAAVAPPDRELAGTSLWRPV